MSAQSHYLFQYSLSSLEKLVNGLEAVRATLGPAEQSGFADESIKDTLYHFYYDVAQTVDYLLGEWFIFSFRNDLTL